MPEIKAVLEVDSSRGVIYVHSQETGHTLLRICGLPTPIPDASEEALDITISEGKILLNWKGR